MKVKIGIWIGLMAMIIMNACDSSSDTDSAVEDGDWEERSSYAGVGRSGAVAFVVGDKAYVGLGFDGDDYLLDFYVYDGVKGGWSKLQYENAEGELVDNDFPGVGRTNAISFSIGNKGYIATGYNDDEEDEELGDFWEYDTVEETWTQLPDVTKFGISARYGSTGFSIGDFGYLCAGYDGNYLKDFWKYNPSDTTWELAQNLTGDKRQNSVSFVIDSYGYVCTGTNNGDYEDDFWEYDPGTDSWLELLEFDEDEDTDEILRTQAVAFTLNGYGYITVGAYGSNTNSTWQYTAGSDIWEEKTAFEGSGRTGAVAFTVNNQAFVGLGQSGSFYYDDLWEFLPEEEYDEDN